MWEVCILCSYSVQLCKGGESFWGAAMVWDIRSVDSDFGGAGCCQSALCAAMDWAFVHRHLVQQVDPCILWLSM